MSTTSLDAERLVVKAYARLKGLRDNVPDAMFAPRVMVDDFNRALQDLKLAGHNLVADFALSQSDMERDFGGVLTAFATVLRARIDAVLIYFRIEEDPEDEGLVKARIGFETPKP